MGIIQNYFFRVINFKLAYIRFGIKALFSILVRIYKKNLKKKVWKGLLIGLGLWFVPTFSLAELPVGSTPKTITLQGELGKLVDGGGPWESDRFKGYVTILFYVDPDEADLNNSASEALKNANLPADQVRSVAVINMDATLLPNFLVQGKLEDKQEEYQNTLYVMDYQKVLVNEWGLGDHNNDVVIFDKQGKVLFSVDGQLNQSQIEGNAGCGQKWF